LLCAKFVPFRIGVPLNKQVIHCVHSHGDVIGVRTVIFSALMSSRVYSRLAVFLAFAIQDLLLEGGQRIRAGIVPTLAWPASASR
jgi:hypothetical protein